MKLNTKRSNRLEKLFVSLADAINSGDYYASACRIREINMSSARLNADERRIYDDLQSAFISLLDQKADEALNEVNKKL